MKRLCAWCGRELDTCDNANNLQVTHGLCPACRQKYFARTAVRIQEEPPIPENLTNLPASPPDNLPRD